jgi:hypothetical protein
MKHMYFGTNKLNQPTVIGWTLCVATANSGARAYMQPGYF